MDIIATIIGLLLLNNYLKIKVFNFMLFCNNLFNYLFHNNDCILKHGCFKSTYTILMNLFNYFNRYSIVVILAFFIGIQFIKEKINDIMNEKLKILLKYLNLSFEYK